MPRCPSCYVPMERVEEGGLKWFTCGTCFGTWIGDLPLLRRLRRAAEQPPAEGATIEDLVETVSASNTKAKLRCAHCEKEMTKEKYHPMIPVGIDVCRRCKFVWTDAGEMALLTALYRELLTSDDPEIVQRRERLAVALSQWESREKLADSLGRNQDDAWLGPDLISLLARRIQSQVL